MAYNEERHTAVEVKDEFMFHMKIKERMEDTIPSGIIIRPFYVIADIMKQFLINKRLGIAKKLLDQFSHHMRALILVVLDEFKLIQMRLVEKPSSIEHIYEIHDWMETISLTIRGFDDTARRYMLENMYYLMGTFTNQFFQEYDILDTFWYNLNQEDFDAKWEAVAWPFRIEKQIDDTNDFLTEETDKFHKIQVTDEYNLQEKIEALVVQVTNMYGLKDASKCHEIAIGIKREWKAIKEAQEQGQLFNSRQKLFLIPVIPFDALSKLIKEFEPYKNFWLTVSDWLHNFFKLLVRRIDIIYSLVL